VAPLPAACHIRRCAELIPTIWYVAFVLVVTFAARMAMLPPLGYQTNLMGYGPGEYPFDRVGALLQVILAVVAALDMYASWDV
jgi:di/tricarboxylate transporter